jgi:hypothetical protein
LPDPVSVPLSGLLRPRTICRAAPRRAGARSAQPHAPAAEEGNAASLTSRTKITRERRMNQRLRFSRFPALKTG